MLYNRVKTDTSILFIYSRTEKFDDVEKWQGPLLRKVKN